jgi:cytochrome c oxidase subunit 4
MVAHDSHAPEEQAHAQHHGGLGKYIAVFVALCALTALSFAVANSSLMQTPAAGWAIMMAVSSAKALLVIAFFMHLIWEANWKYVLTIPASIMACFLVFMLVPDIGLRTRHYSQERWRQAARPITFKRSAMHGGVHHGPQLPYSPADVQRARQAAESDPSHSEESHAQ